MSALDALEPLLYAELVRRELAADLGDAGDVTSRATLPADAVAAAELVVRARGRLCGLEVALSVFDHLSDHLFNHRGGIDIERLSRDGADVAAGQAVARLEGNARALLAGERTALNFLGHLSGIATATAELVALVGHHPARIVCTRKTTPGLRALEKYAVRAGGGANHRFGLYDAVLIKDNHREMAGGAAAAVRAARERLGHTVKLEIEVDNLDQLEEVLGEGVDSVLLDNMSTAELERAVAANRGRALLEASGGVTAATVPEIAATGVDLISVGWITHSAPALDVGLDFRKAAKPLSG